MDKMEREDEKIEKMWNVRREVVTVQGNNYFRWVQYSMKRVNMNDDDDDDD